MDGPATPKQVRGEGCRAAFEAAQLLKDLNTVGHGQDEATTQLQRVFRVLQFFRSVASSLFTLPGRNTNYCNAQVFIWSCSNSSADECKRHTGS